MAEPVFLPNLDHHRTLDPKLWETLTAIQSHLRPVSQPAPPPVSNIAVTAANGWFTVALTDNGKIGAGIHYFIEYSTTAGFEQPVVVDNGASRTAVLNLGNQTLFWRAYSQYLFPFSPPSPPIMFGAPTGVAGGGAVAPPVVASTGSGTGATNGQQGGSGFGRSPVRQIGNRPSLL